ncbi:hypothetical protein [Propionibacterium australiense]|uniref:FepE-like-protein n=1 Tax=Propionibacterium australiense TaxID=119981 RepID=A0A383S7B7_9ACTN|nr:hypothetical protein [Propionibacterium australiense]RLP08984.1 hypothetical protein D9T14_07680 [Propionibacterium australiense]RLP09081.1 hypothetical protein D7U36_08065 [Propionibacterium australiense]SYZ33452.1 FepE-like-protein [Propionibacterium australiense]VEH91817.1 Capsular polysaccharide biosynthesis protein [Propionibacterium australiense]
MSILTPPPTGGPQILWHELQRRWREIVTGVLLGGLLASVAILILPSTHSAASSVTITSPSPTPEPASRTSLSSTDMVTEKGIATSGTTLRQALNSMDTGDLTLSDLKSGLKVEGDTNGTVVTITWSGSSRDQAVAVANAITAAYIDQRTALTRQRADEMAKAITDRIASLNEEAARLDTGSSAGQTRAETIRTEIADLTKQQDQLAAYNATAARVITGAEDSPDIVSPPRMRTIAIGLLVGLVAGLAIGLVRERREKRVLSARQLSDLTGLPVWGAQDGVAPEAQWDAPAQLAALSIGKRSDLIIMADGADPRALAFTQALDRAREAQSATPPISIDRRMPLAEIIGRLGDGGRILIGTATGASLGELHALLDQLNIADRDVTGLVLFDGEIPVAPAQVIGQRPQGPAAPWQPPAQAQQDVQPPQATPQTPVAESWRAVSGAAGSWRAVSQPHTGGLMDALLTEEPQGPFPADQPQRLSLVGEFDEPISAGEPQRLSLVTESDEFPPAEEPQGEPQRSSPDEPDVPTPASAEETRPADAEPEGAASVDEPTVLVPSLYIAAEESAQQEETAIADEPDAQETGRVTEHRPRSSVSRPNVKSAASYSRMIRRQNRGRKYAGR